MNQENNRTANGSGAGSGVRPMRSAAGRTVPSSGIYIQPSPASPMADRPATDTPAAAAPPSSKYRQQRNWRSVLSTLLLFLLAPLIALFIMAFVVQSYQVEGESMETTLQNGDRLIVDKVPRTWARITRHPYIPHRGDIIIFNEVGTFDTATPQEKQLIKRVIGLPGDRVIIQNGSVTIKDGAHPAGFDPDKTVGYHITAPSTTAANDINLVLGKDQIYVLGDNRGNSEDSRYFGPIEARQIVGKLVLRIMPLDKAETF